MKRLVSKQISLEMEQTPADSAGFRILRDLCLELQDVSIVVKFGRTEFKVGTRPFVIVETHCNPDGTVFHCMAFKASFLDQEKLGRSAAYFPAPYLGGAGWLGCRLDNPSHDMDWVAMEAILKRSHRQLATQSGSRRRPPVNMKTSDAPINASLD